MAALRRRLVSQTYKPPRGLQLKFHSMPPGQLDGILPGDAARAAAALGRPGDRVPGVELHAHRPGIARDHLDIGRLVADVEAEREAEAVGQRQLVVDHVARARNKSSQEVEPLARGRVWLGTDALGKGLVDHLGGFELAVALAREAAGKKDLEPEARVIVGHMPSRRDELPEAKRVLAALASLMPEELAPLVAVVESRASIVVLAASDRLR